ncbi:M60 family metallopeptidase [Providencia sp. SP181]|uniref:M60 family metallopeptidase n=1 Tax=Providencia sp. SP181 TaxID=3136277 RepID=UPI003D2C11E2
MLLIKNLNFLKVAGCMFFIFIIPPVYAKYFDIHNNIYTISSLPDSNIESHRMDSMKLSDQQPTGKYLLADETLTIKVEGVNKNQNLSVMIGFRPMFGVDLDQQEIRLSNGVSTIKSNQDGPIFLRLTSLDDINILNNFVKIQFYGGRNLPFFIQGESTLSDWHSELANYKNAPYVQLLSQRAMITLPRAVYNNYPIKDPSKTLIMINKVIQMQDELAGFDNKTPKDRSSPLRHHFIVDFRTQQQDKFYMYASNEFIGMQFYNTKDLTEPYKLSTEWAIWHEIGHTYQQRSWTWDSLTEISVNLFSLYVQEKMGQPSRLSEKDENGFSMRDKSMTYRSLPIKNYLHESEDEDELFIKLVMFEEIKNAYGWFVFSELFKRIRALPLTDSVDEQLKVDTFIINICKITGDDLREYFYSWGLYASTTANLYIANLKLKPAGKLHEIYFNN